MRYYETLYILNSNFEQELIDNVVKDVNESVGKFSTVINHRVWGKKRLAYEIDHQKYGTFMLLQFEAEKPEALLGFDDYLKLNNSIMRHQTVRLDQKPDIYEPELTEVSDDTETESAESDDDVTNKTDSPEETLDSDNTNKTEEPEKEQESDDSDDSDS